MAARKNPGGGKGQDKFWSAAISRAVNELRSYGDDPKKVKALFLLARKLVDEALDGNMAAMREIGDRLDGRPAQAITGHGGGPVELAVTHISGVERAQRMAAILCEGRAVDDVSPLN